MTSLYGGDARNRHHPLQFILSSHVNYHSPSLSSSVSPPSSSHTRTPSTIPQSVVPPPAVKNNIISAPPAPENGHLPSPETVISAPKSPPANQTIYDDEERLAKCKNLIEIIQGDDREEETVFTGITDDEHAYIMQFIDEDDETQGRWTWRRS
ncbi:hypothetical protein BDR03DRAFT_981649 [Suillus americanus]|nr:hypothetical protein BDR03DRAFT_981649 [Suillus americanus]